MGSLFILFLKSELLLVFTDNISGDSSAQHYWTLHTHNGWSGSLKHKSITNKTRLVSLHAEAHVQGTETDMRGSCTFAQYRR